MHTRQWYVFFAYMLRIIQVNMALLFWVEAWKKVQINSWNLLFFVLLWEENFGPFLSFIFCTRCFHEEPDLKQNFSLLWDWCRNFWNFFSAAAASEKFFSSSTYVFLKKCLLFKKAKFRLSFFSICIFIEKQWFVKKTLFWVFDDLATSFISLELAFNGTQVWQQLGAIIR